MLNVIKIEPNCLDLDLSGELDTEAVRNALDAFAEAAEGVTNCRMLYRIRNSEIPSIGAIAVGFALIPRLPRMNHTFEKCAVLCDTS